MNITLIGMAGAGKSFIGKALAEKIKYGYIDVDKVIESKLKLKLKDIIKKQGERKFLKIEEKTILGFKSLKNHIISPGGSVVYSRGAMRFLKGISKVVYLDVPFDTIKQRIPSMAERGIIRLNNSSLRMLFNQRVPLYKKYADIIIKIKPEIALNVVINKIKKQVNVFELEPK